MGSSYVVNQGDCLSSIARAHGFVHWQTLYDHPDNLDFRNRRPNPSVIFPGDVVVIPELEAKTVSRPSGRGHTFRLTRPRVRFRIVVEDLNLQNVSDARYELEIDGRVTEGMLTDGATIEESIQADARGGQLRVWPRDDEDDYFFEWDLKLGQLDPVDELSGIQARLSHLFYDAGPVDGLNGPKTKGGIKAFQSDHGLAVDGIAGPLTQAKLVAVHGT